MLKVAMNRHVVYNLATCRKFVRHCKALFDKVQGWDKATSQTAAKNLGAAAALLQRLAAGCRQHTARELGVVQAVSEV